MALYLTCLGHYYDCEHQLQNLTTTHFYHSALSIDHHASPAPCLQTHAKPTFVLVHGAWHTPAHWDPLITSLKSHDYTAVAPALPSMIDPDTPGSIVAVDQDSDIAAVREAIMHQLGQGSDVIVVPHSYGGMPAVSALRDLDTATRSRQGHHASVVAIAAISTWLVPQGMTINQDQEPATGLHDYRDGLLFLKEKPGPVAFFYHDLPKDEAERWVALLKPGASIAALMQPSKYTAYEHIPVHYLMCTEDHANPTSIQEMVIDRIRKESKGETDGGKTALQSQSLPE